MDDTAATALGSGAESDAQAMLRTGQGLNEDQLGKVLQLTSDGMIISDGAERILHANPVALALFDVDLNDIVNTPLEDLLGCMKAVDDASLLAHLADASSQEPDRVFQVFRRLIQIEQAPIPITSDSQGSLTVLRDVTSLVRGEEKLAELRERAQQLMNRTEHLSKLDYLKSRFIADMSHDLRNPLNSIIGFSSVILKGIDGPITDLQREDLEKINSSGKILLEMVSDMLDVSQLWAGKTQLRYSPIDLNSLIQEALAQAAPLVGDKPIKLEYEPVTGLPPLEADGERIGQVLRHLLSNAISYTERGEVAIKVEPQAGQVVVSVSDTGIGIPPQHLEHVFEEFFQVDDPAARKAGGMGLGLSISSRLIEMHGGKIWVESSPGTGSTFYFSLPGGEPTSTQQ